MDEFLLTPMTNEQAKDLLEVIEPRAELGSIIFCIQFEPVGWHERIRIPFWKTCTGLPEGMHLVSEKCALPKRNIHRVSLTSQQK